MRLFQTRLEFGGPLGVYELHQRLWRPFPGVARGEKQPFLFRADILAGEVGPITRTLLRSIRMPEVDLLGAGARVLSPPTPFDSVASPGSEFRFMLRANPIRAAKPSHHALKDLRGEAFRSERGRRVGIFGEEARQEWLNRKAIVSGFSVVHVDGSSAPCVIQKRPRLVRWTSPSGTGQRARHDGIDFEGILRVEDSALFARAVAEGIGPAKAFGFGLLSLQRVAR